MNSDDKGDIAGPTRLRASFGGPNYPACRAPVSAFGPARDRLTSHLRFSSLVSLGQGHWGKMVA
jgi:hypothetical protein